MKIQRFDPAALIQSAVASAEQSLKSQTGKLSSADVAGLPAALQQVAKDAFAGQAVSAKDLVGAYQKTLEKTLGTSLQSGTFVAAETAKALDLVAFSPVAVQLGQALVEQSRPKSAVEADVVAQSALKSADSSVASQLALQKALVQASGLHQKENPKGAAAKDLATVVKAREKILKKAADETVKNAEQALAKREPGAKEAVMVALSAAIDVYKALSPKSSRIKTLEKKRADLGTVSLDRAQGLPFFARFLESQTQQGQQAPAVNGDIGQMVTMKFPSDNEDGAVGDEGLAVTKKFPSDAEDTGGGIDDGMMVTMKYPSDNEDGAGEVVDDNMAVTKKFPSDHEDGGGAIDDGMMVTMKYPSDNEDGAGEVVDDGMMVTMKFPSDNEDGAGEVVDDGMMVTMKYPSDNEDGAGEVVDDGMMVTRKFPSDNEDGGGAIEGPGGVGGTEPEPTLDPATALKRRTIDVEERVNTLMLQGPAAMEQRASGIGDLLVRARLPQETYAGLVLEKEALHTVLGGRKVIDEKITSIEKLLMTALMAPEEHAVMQAELSFYKDLKADFSSFSARIGELDKKKMKTPAETAERAVLKLFADGGIKPLFTRYEALVAQLDNATTKPPLELTLERMAIKGFLNGDVWMKDRVVEIDEFMSRAMMSPEAVTAHSQEKQLMEALRADLKPFATRAIALQKALAEIDGVPEIAPVDVATKRATLELEGGIMKSMWHGMAGVDARLQDLVRTLAPGSTGKEAIELRVLQAAKDGVPGLQARLAELENTLTVARMLEPARREMELERDVTKAVLANTDGLTDRIAQLGRLRFRTPTQELELAIIDVGAKGFDALQGRIDEIDDLMTRARFTPEGLEKIQLERAGLKFFMNGGQVLRDRIAELEYIMATSRMTEEAKQKVDSELSLCRALESNLAPFEQRAMAISDELAQL